MSCATSPRTSSYTNEGVVMDVDRIFSLVGLIIGVAGIALALFQTYRMKHANRVVADWGSDILNRLQRAQKHVAELRGRAHGFAPVQWTQAQGEVENGL